MINTKKLKDCCTIIAGQSPESKYYNSDGNGLPFFQGKADFGDLYPSIRVYCSQPTKIAEKDDILLSVRAPVGPTNFAPCTVCIGRGLTAIRPSKELLIKYVLLFFRYFEAQLASKGTGTTFKAITQDIVKNLEIPVPPLNEQQHIVSRIEELFSSLDNAVETLQKTKEQLAVYRQAVLKEVLESHGSCNSTLGEVILSLQNGIAKRKGANGKNIIVLRLANIDNEKILDSSEMRSIMLTDNEQESYLLNEGDGLIVRVNGSMDRVGRMVIVGINGKYAFCDHLIRCVFNKDKIIPHFAKYLLDNAVSRKHIKNNAVSTAGQNTISQGTIKSCPIYLPSLEEQRIMIQEIESRLSMCDSIEQTVNTALAQAEAMRQSILKDAFEGRL